MGLRNFVSRQGFLATVSMLVAVMALVAGCATVDSTKTPINAVSVTVSPTSASVTVSGSQKFTAKVANSSNSAVTWMVNGTAGGDATHGKIDASGMYTAPAAVPSPAAVTITAVSAADASKNGAATVTVGAATAVSVSTAAGTVSVQTGKTSSLMATVQNDSQNQGVSWALSGAGCTGAACGTLSAASSASGTAITYTAPAAAPTPATVTATATAVADTTKTATTVITLTAIPVAIAVTVNPTTASVQIGKTLGITATVTNDAGNKGVSYTLSGTGCTGAACGALSAASGASGVAVVYTAPATVPAPATVSITATSVADTTKKAVATITVTTTATAGVAVSVAPKRVALTTGQTQTFAATVTGNANTAVTWEVDSIPSGNASVGTVSATGVYTPTTSAGTHTVGARSAADTTAAATASVAITDLAGVFTYHNDLARDGVNSKEYALNTTTVKAATFGKQFSCAVDAQVYAQPLWYANVTIGGAKHNVVIAATQHNTMYAFDADASPCVTLWQKSLMASGETWLSSGDVDTTDITPDIGIVGTPVIDPATGTIYVVSKSKNGSTFHQRLHALSVTDGTKKFTGPTEIAFSAGGFTFDSLRENERCGLALVNGIVYIAWASHGDMFTYYGWIAGYNASNLTLTSVYNDDPVQGGGGQNGGIWMSGGAPAADNINGTTSLYVITGNGPFDGTTQFGDSFLKLSTGSNMNLTSFFAPREQDTLRSGDLDLGSGGTAVLVDQPTTPNHLLIGGGKEGFLYVLNRDSLGGYDPQTDHVAQTISTGNGIFSTPAFWQGTLYLGSAGGTVKAYKLSGSGLFNGSTSSTSPTSYNWPGATPSVSSQGTANGVIWALERNGSAILHAYDATNLNTELWNSAAKASDATGSYVKFTVPTVANGKVYVGTASSIDVFGLAPN